jgi:flagellar basal-body rod modification protein FlgD
MTTVASSTSSASATTASLTGSRTTMAQNFDTFLQLLTTQLRNQSPLDPLDTNQFTAQLVQFAQVEQSMKSNDMLQSLLTLQRTAQIGSAVNYIGTDIVATGSEAPLDGGRAEWTLVSPQAGARATLTIRNSRGQIVHATERVLAQGTQAYTWDGRDTSGATLPAGTYTISVSARDAAENNVNVSTEVRGRVDGVDLSVDPPLLKIGNRSVPVDQIRQVLKPNGA